MPRPRVPASEQALAGDAFHQAAVAGEDVGVVVNQRQAVAVVARRHVAFGNGEADCGGDTLAKRPGGELNAGCVVVFGVAGGFAVQLAEVFQVVKREVVAGEVQRRVLQHGCMTVGEDEAVAVMPLGICRVGAQVVEPKDGCHVAMPIGAPGWPELALHLRPC